MKTLSDTKKDPLPLKLNPLFFDNFCLKSIKASHGVSIVEFAIILPLFLLFVFAIIEFGVFMYDKAILTNAAREGTRAGVLYGNNFELIDVKNDIYSFYRANCEAIKKEIKDRCQKSMVSFGTDSIEDEDITIFWEGMRDAEELVFTCANDEYKDLISGDRIVVDVSYKFDFLFLSNIFDGITMTAQTVMRIE